MLKNDKINPLCIPEIHTERLKNLTTIDLKIRHFYGQELNNIDLI